MLNIEHLLENAIVELEKYEVHEAYRQFMESPCNIELAENAGIRLDDVWVMAVYCDTTLRQDWKEKWEDEADRWIPVTERLPENDEAVLGYLPGMKRTQSKIQTLMGWMVPIHATHWMPLPEPPGEDDHA